MIDITRYVLVGSLEPYSGKSATVLGIGGQLKAQGFEVGYGKPLATSNGELTDKDDTLIAEILELSPDHLYPTVVFMDQKTIQARVLGTETFNPEASFPSQYQKRVAQTPSRFEESPGRIVILEGPATLDEGRLFGLSLGQMAEYLGAGVVLVIPFHPQTLIDRALSAQHRLGASLLGVVINDITAEYIESFDQTYAPYLEAQNIAVLGRLPRSNLLRSVSVGELVKRLKATVLCRSDRLDLMVESLRIGAMNVNSALKYFRKGENMAVVTGGDRTDIQLAALETSTQCLILTGHLSPSELIISRAEELEIPILAVDLDTLTTVEIIDNAFGKAPIQEKVKIQCISELMAAHFDLNRFLQQVSSL